MTLARWRPCLGLGVALFGACGGTTRNGPGGVAGSDDGGTAGNVPGGSGNGAGKASGGSSSVAGAAGATAGSSAAGNAAGGKRPDEPITAGAGDGQDPRLSCDTPYAGPTGGPCVDGPQPTTGSCAAMDDALIVARYGDFKARVARGLYCEEPGAFQHWELPCSNSLAETVERGSKRNLGTAKGKFTTDWFYEAEFCDGKTRGVYRNLRCDYYDGAKLTPATPENLAFLRSLLWWAENWNHDGSALLGYTVTVGDATDSIEMCSLEATYGDFGLCDEVRLLSAQDSILFGGAVQLGDAKLLRTVKGRCH